MDASAVNAIYEPAWKADPATRPTAGEYALYFFNGNSFAWSKSADREPDPYGRDWVDDLSAAALSRVAVVDHYKRLGVAQGVMLENPDEYWCEIDGMYRGDADNPDAALVAAALAVHAAKQGAAR